MGSFRSIYQFLKEIIELNCDKSNFTIAYTIRFLWYTEIEQKACKFTLTFGDYFSIIGFLVERVFCWFQKLPISATYSNMLRVLTFSALFLQQILQTPEMMHTNFQPYFYHKKTITTFETLSRLFLFFFFVFHNTYFVVVYSLQVRQMHTMYMNWLGVF